jgi:hypothetical protein
MGIIVIGTLYNPRQSDIAWSQPGGPGTTVFPQEQVNVPFTAYPTGGQLWAENSGIWVAGCGHWQNEPMIWQDFDGFVVSYVYLQDSLGRNWQIGITDDGTQILATQVAFTANSVVLLTDLVTAQTYQLTVVPNVDATDVDLQLTPVGGSGGQDQLLVLSANGTLYGIQVSSGALQTAYPLAAEGSPVAICTCNLCSYIQYVIPLAQFYDTFRTPVTII